MRKKKKYNWSKKRHQTVDEYVARGGIIKRASSLNYQYDTYMSSPMWLKDKRASAFKLLGSRCEVCFAGQEQSVIHVHHNNYYCLGSENPSEDLAILCKGCHDDFHKKNPSSSLREKKEAQFKRRCHLCSRVTSYIGDVRYRAPQREIDLCSSCFQIFKNKLIKENITFNIKEG